MVQQINEQVDVIAICQRNKNVKPYKFFWKGREHKITEVGYYHRRKVGASTEHVFDTTDGANSYRLVCRGDNLQWFMEEISDGN